MSSCAAAATTGATTLAAVVGERLDRAMTLELRPMTGGLPAGIVVPIYDICRTLQPLPLSTAAATLLIERLTPTDTVWIVTGAGIGPALPHGETDGPPGAAALGRAIRLALGARAVLVTEPAHAPAVLACAEIAGHDLDHLIIPSGADTPESLDQLLSDGAPAVLIFVERDGANREGRYHGVRGNTRPDGSVVALDRLAGLAQARGIATIGIGDGGNEVGFGAVRDQIAALLPRLGASDGGWPSGRVTAHSTDVVVSASVSNWGAYAVCAALAALTGCRDACWAPDLERRAVEAAVHAGAYDGATGAAAPVVDGITLDTHAAVVVLFAAIADTALG
ncbi:glutamate cyclase domain-containing protein [Mycobacterium sp. 236(2023)]|uniref:glutamate cyclase domain-containing protein n=1 Tax=Mycobacterium sp. 236(2023) TaxID=3038163 RepID=UPI002414E1B8|nr:glutamate cyclase domain-containing protein [Mycobacterium sp. 236(2023)]MDG4669341.1 DUF4392 domain-containing protein [Mycobacterium sp. 236(2023)]